jgi:hypothetical protein
MRRFAAIEAWRLAGAISFGSSCHVGTHGDGDDRVLSLFHLITLNGSELVGRDRSIVGCYLCHGMHHREADDPLQFPPFHGLILCLAAVVS